MLRILSMFLHGRIIKIKTRTIQRNFFAKFEKFFKSHCKIIRVLFFIMLWWWLDATEQGGSIYMEYLKRRHLGYFSIGNEWQIEMIGLRAKIGDSRLEPRLKQEAL